MRWNMGKTKRIFNSKVYLGIFVLISLLLCKDYIIKEVNTLNVKHITFHDNTIVVQVLGLTSNTFTTDPNNLDPFAFKWSSSNEKIATVSEFGIIEALSVGEATITARGRNGIYDTFAVKVVEHY
jgi:hypothetical protein